MHPAESPAVPLARRSPTLGACVLGRATSGRARKAGGIPPWTPRRHCAAPGRAVQVRAVRSCRSRTGPQDVSRLWCFIAGYLGKGDTFARALLEFSTPTPSRTTATTRPSLSVSHPEKPGSRLRCAQFVRTPEIVWSAWWALLTVAAGFRRRPRRGRPRPDPLRCRSWSGAA